MVMAAVDVVRNLAAVECDGKTGRGGVYLREGRRGGVYLREGRRGGVI